MTTNVHISPNRADLASALCFPRNIPGRTTGLLAGMTLAALLVMNAARAQSPVKIMPLGDSITYGFNGINYPNGSIPGGYRTEMGMRLAAAGVSYDLVGSRSDNPAPGIDPHHEGHPGIRTDQVLANLSTWLAVNPDIVLMHLGTNDMLQHVPVSTAANNLRSIIQQITGSSSSRRLYVATIIPIIDTRNGHTPSEWATIIGQYNAQVRSIVQQYANLGRKVYLVEMNAGLTYTDPNNASNNFFQPGDGTHPALAGYRQMGAFWFNALRSVESFSPPVPGTQLLANGSFESDFTSWQKTGNLIIQSAGGYIPTDGSRLAAFNVGNSAPNGVLTQTFPTTSGTTYTLTFDAGCLAYTGSPQVLQVTVAGGSTVLSQTVSISGTGSGTASWVRKNFSFVANSGSSTIAFRDQSVSHSAIDLLLDNVRITRGGTTAPNTAPVANADYYATNMNTPLVVPAPGVLGNDTDAQGHPLTAILAGGPSHGSVTLNPNGGFSYTPASNHTGTATFSYRCYDGSQSSNVVSVNITVDSGVAVPLTNGSFESGFTGWNSSGNQMIVSGAPYTATNGTNLVRFNGGNSDPDGVLSQSFATTSGRSYLLAFDAGVLSYNTSSQALQVTVSGAGQLLSQTITLNGTGNGTNLWQERSFSFVANSTFATLTFRDQSTSTNALDLLLDNVRITSSASMAVARSDGEETESEVSASETRVVPIESPFMGSPSLIGAPGDFVIRLTVTQPGSYFLQRSTDLIAWEHGGDIHVEEPGLIEFNDTRRPVGDTMFYRIGRHGNVIAD